MEAEARTTLGFLGEADSRTTRGIIWEAFEEVVSAPFTRSLKCFHFYRSDLTIQARVAEFKGMGLPKQLPGPSIYAQNRASYQAKIEAFKRQRLH